MNEECRCSHVGRNRSTPGWVVVGLRSWVVESPLIHEELPEWMVVEWHKITLCPAVPAILRVSIFKSKRLKEGSLSFQNLQQKIKSVENSSQQIILSWQNIEIVGISCYVHNWEILWFPKNSMFWQLKMIFWDEFSTDFNFCWRFWKLRLPSFKRFGLKMLTLKMDGTAGHNVILCILRPFIQAALHMWVSFHH